MTWVFVRGSMHDEAFQPRWWVCGKELYIILHHRRCPLALHSLIQYIHVESWFQWSTDDAACVNADVHSCSGTPPAGWSGVGWPVPLLWVDSTSTGRRKKDLYRRFGWDFVVRSNYLWHLRQRCYLDPMDLQLVLCRILPDRYDPCHCIFVACSFPVTTVISATIILLDAPEKAQQKSIRSQSLGSLELNNQKSAVTYSTFASHFVFPSLSQSSYQPLLFNLAAYFQVSKEITGLVLFATNEFSREMKHFVVATLEGGATI
jgi:hypothetical protein